MHDERSEPGRPEEGGAKDERVEPSRSETSGAKGYEGAGVEEGGGYQRTMEGGGYEQSGTEDPDYDPRREGDGEGQP
jgi:hypothetical protein